MQNVKHYCLRSGLWLSRGVWGEKEMSSVASDVFPPSDGRTSQGPLALLGTRVTMRKEMYKYVYIYMYVVQSYVYL